MIRDPLPPSSVPPRCPCIRVEKRGGWGGRGGRRSRKRQKGKVAFFAWIRSTEEERVWAPVSVMPPSPAQGRAGRWSEAGLCGGLVRLAYGFTSVHHRRLTCAFTGGRGHLGHQGLSNVVQRWLSVHGHWGGAEGKAVSENFPSAVNIQVKTTNDLFVVLFQVFFGII